MTSDNNSTSSDAAQLGILAQASGKRIIKLLGELVYLMLSSDLHRKYFINDIGSVFFPPIDLNQFRIYYKNGGPVGFVTWASLSKEIEERYLSTDYILRPQDWNSGDRILFMDFMAPFGDGKNIVRDLRKNIFPDIAARSVRVRGDAKLRVRHLHGVNYMRARHTV
ncbi:toxin-activating lysine-acyltransferase [Agrobacterium sp. NPDC089420]|uniref:toxin-activating lysine-acyltransferase n=1 Tax=Agrobacterium sp. NPDC089420 TaxID=3363918 RepID=UPI00384E69F3